MVAIVLFATAAPAVAEKQLVDRIVAVVEDEAIFASDIDMLVRQFMMEQKQKEISSAEMTQLQEKVLTDLINDKLVIAQAARLRVTVPFDAVEEQVNKAIDENRRLLGGEDAFIQQLEREGFTIESLKKLYRQQVHNRMLVEEVLKIETKRQGSRAGEDELRRFYEENKDTFQLRPAVAHLKTIFVGFETSTQAKDAARARIDSVEARVNAGEAFAELAREYSDDPSGKTGGDLGFLKAEDLRDPVFAATAGALDVGEISEPVLTSYGFHLIRVTEKNPDTGEMRISHILVRIDPSDNDILEVLDSANAIYEQLVAGAPFDSLAGRYNTDPTTDAFGDLGWLKVDELPEFFRDVLEGLSPGEISHVLRESSGFRIVKLLESEAVRPYEYAEIVGQLRNMYQQDRMNTIYATYLEELRQKFTVDLKQ